MNKKSLEYLRLIATRIPKQCPCDIAAALCPICDEWKFIFLNGCLVFMAGSTPTLVLPLCTIYGTLKTSDTLYILCNNNILHFFDRKTHQHWATFLDDTDEDMLCRILN